MRTLSNTEAELKKSVAHKKIVYCICTENKCKKLILCKLFYLEKRTIEVRMI